eukprot:g5246.t1
MDEVQKHNTEDDCWLAIKGKVYDVTPFLDDHPGGPEVVTDCAGTESTDAFEDIGHSVQAREQLAQHLIGDLDGYVAPKVDESKKGGNGGSNMGIFLVAGVVIAAAVAATQFM